MLRNVQQHQENGWNAVPQVWDQVRNPLHHSASWISLCGIVKKECNTRVFAVAKFVTIDDEPCELPIFYEGSLHKECVQIEGIPMCHARQGPWKECRSSMQSPVERWDPPSWEEHYGTSALDVAALGVRICASLTRN